jgi:hypothetical protein
MIVYMGVGFVLFGMFLLLIGAIGGAGQGVFVSLGVLVFGMGTILSYVGLKAGNNDRLQSSDNAVSAWPLSYLQSEAGQGAHEHIVSGNKALGFVLISLGAFILAVAGVFGLFVLSWPLSVIGIGLVLPGVLLRAR